MDNEELVASIGIVTANATTIPSNRRPLAYVKGTPDAAVLLVGEIPRTPFSWEVSALLFINAVPHVLMRP